MSERDPISQRLEDEASRAMAILTNEAVPEDHKNFIYRDCYQSPRLVAAIANQLRKYDIGELEKFLERIAFGPFL